MKTYRTLPKLLLLFVLISIVSCTPEPAATPADLARLNNAAGNSGGGSSTGDYWPAKIGNKWVLDQSGVQSTMEILSSETINGATYYKFNQIAGQGSVPGVIVASQWLKKQGGDYYVKIDDISIDISGIKGTLSGYEYVFLKDYLEVNQSWSGTYNQTTTSQGIPPFETIVSLKGTILEKGISISVNGKTYNDVIKFRMHQEASSLGQVVTIDIDYWFAKNIGFIKMTTGATTTQIVSYSLQ